MLNCVRTTHVCDGHRKQQENINLSPVCLMTGKYRLHLSWREKTGTRIGTLGYLNVLIDHNMRAGSFVSQKINILDGFPITWVRTDAIDKEIF